MSGYIIDTETTGTDPKLANIIELAYGPISEDLRTFSTVTCTRFKPDVKIDCGAMAVHHIIPDDLKDCSHHSQAKLPADAAYIIGHNVDFDWNFLGQPDVRRICTLALARHVWPQVGSHTLGACIYRILPFDVARERLRNAHSAGADVHLCHELLSYLLDEYFECLTLEELWTVSEDARLFKIWTFGKFKGKPLAAADRGYMSWCLRQPDMDEYVKKTIQKYLEE